MQNNLQQTLQRLEDLILEERDCARKLKVDRLKQMQEEKGVLIKELRDEETTIPQELHAQVGRIKRDNIRNARLLHTCLNNLRSMMDNCTKQIIPASYNNYGGNIQASPSGLLLRGRI